MEGALMKNIFAKKILAMMMAAMMVVTYVPAVSFAAEGGAATPPPDKQSVQYADAENSAQDAAAAAEAVAGTAAETAFEQSAAVDDVIVTVRADQGVFPEGAALSAEKAAKEEQELAVEAVDAVRPEGINAALSYTFDIKMLDPEGNELQPAEGKKAEVTFAMAPFFLIQRKCGNIWNLG